MAETTVENPVEGTEGEEVFAEVTTFESEVPVEGEYTSESLASRFGDPQPAMRPWPSEERHRPRPDRSGHRQVEDQRSHP